MPANTKEEIFAALSDSHAFLKELGVKRCGLFGSFVRGEQSPESDVDILVEFQDGRKSFDNFMRLAFFLEEVLGRRVDLVTPESLSRHIGPRILREVEYEPVRA